MRKLLFSGAVITFGLVFLAGCGKNKETTVTSAVYAPFETYEFGFYPQSLVTADASNGLSSIAFDESTWTDYGYYANGSVESYMYYYDLDLDNDGNLDYRGVYFTSYRPYSTASSNDQSHSNQDDHNYYTDTIYWFRYEPIKWDVMEKKNGRAMLVAQNLLDAQDYHCGCDSRSTATDYQGNTSKETVYANNYMYSRIRSWLNTSFFETAFTGSEKELIAASEIDNSAASTGSSSNAYACENTYDRVFLLSYEEVMSYYGDKNREQEYHPSRCAEFTDYAKCQGGGGIMGSLLTYDENPTWWLRSADAVMETSVRGVNAETEYGIGADAACIGVRAACWITLEN